MSVNFAKAHILFDTEQKKYLAAYIRAGMSPEKIREIQEFDRAQFNRDLAFGRHNTLRKDLVVPVDFELGRDDEAERPIDERVDQNPQPDKETEELLTQATNDQLFSDTTPYSWLNDLSDIRLLKGLCALKREDLDLINMNIVQGMTQQEIASMLGVSQATVYRRLSRIKAAVRIIGNYNTKETGGGQKSTYETSEESDS